MGEVVDIYWPGHEEDTGLEEGTGDGDKSSSGSGSGLDADEEEMGSTEGSDGDSQSGSSNSSSSSGPEWWRGEVKTMCEETGEGTILYTGGEHIYPIDLSEDSNWRSAEQVKAMDAAAAFCNEEAPPSPPGGEPTPIGIAKHGRLVMDGPIGQGGLDDVAGDVRKKISAYRNMPGMFDLRAPKFAASLPHAPEMDCSALRAYSSTVCRNVAFFKSNPAFSRAMLRSMVPNLLEMAQTVPENAWYVGPMAVIHTDTRVPGNEGYVDTQMNEEHPVDGNTGIQTPNEYQLLHLLRMSAALPPTAQLEPFFNGTRTLLLCLGLILRKGQAGKYVPIERALFLEGLTTTFQGH